MIETFSIINFIKFIEYFIIGKSSYRTPNFMSSAKPAAPKTFGIFSTEISEDTDVEEFLKKLVGKKKENIIKDFQSELDSDWNVILVTTSSNEDMIKFNNENTVITRIDMKIFINNKDEIGNYIDEKADKGILDFSAISTKFNFYKYPSQLTTILFIAGVYSYNEDIRISLLNLSYSNIKILKFSFKALFPDLKSIDLSGNPILKEEKEPWQNEFNIIVNSPPPKDLESKKEPLQLNIPNKKEKAIIPTDKLKMYAIFNKSINTQTDAKRFLSNIVNEKILNELEPTLEPTWHLIFVEAKYNLVIYSNKDTAITTFDYQFFMKNKANITSYVSKNIINASLDLSNLKSRFNYFRFDSQLPTFLYITGIYSMILGNKIVSIDLSNNEIKMLKFSFKIIFPDLQKLNVTGNPAAEDIKSDYKDFFEVLTYQKKVNPYSIKKSDAPLPKKGKQKMYAIFNRNINNGTNLLHFLSSLIKDDQICSELIDPGLEPNWNLIFVQSTYNLVSFTNPQTAITGFDLPFFQNNNMHLVKYVADTFQQKSGSIDLSNIWDKFDFYKYDSQLNTVLFIIGIDSIRKNRRIIFIDLSNNKIDMLRFSFKIIFPFLQRINISNNPIEKLKPDPCYSSYLNPPFYKKSYNAPVFSIPPTPTLSQESVTFAIYNKRISNQTNPQQFLFELTNNNNLCRQSQCLFDKHLNLIIVQTKYPLKDYQNKETAIDVFDLKIYNEKLINLLSAYTNSNIRVDGSLDLSYLQGKFNGIYNSFNQIPTFLLIIGILSIRNHKKITKIDLSHNSITQFTFHFPVLFPHLEFIDLAGQLPKNNYQRDNIFNTIPLNCILKSVKTDDLTYTIKLPIGKFFIFDENIDESSNAEDYLMSIFKNKRICDKLHPEYHPDTHFIYVESQYNLEAFNSKNTAIISYDDNIFTRNTQSITDYAKENITDGYIDLSKLNTKFTFYQNPKQLTTVLLIIGIYSITENPDITSINLSDNKIMHIRFPFKSFFPNIDTIIFAGNPIVNHANFEKFFEGIKIIKSELHLPENPPEFIPENPPEFIPEKPPGFAPEKPPGFAPEKPQKIQPTKTQGIPIENLPKFTPIVDINENLNEEEEGEEEEEEEEEEESDDDDGIFEYEEDDFDKYLSYSDGTNLKSEDKKSSFKKRFHYEDKELPSHIDFSIKSKFQEEPNFCLPEHRVSLSDFEAIRLNVHEFPTHEFITSFFYDSWMQIETIQDYYGPDSVFSLCVQIRNEHDLKICPSLFYYKKYSRNLLLPNTNIAIGSANIARANSDFLFVNGFKAKPTSFSFSQAGNNFCYVFHGVFESDICIDVDAYIQKNVKEIMMFDRSFNIILREEGFVISNDNLLVRMYKY